MSVQPIRPNGDERIQHKTAVLNGFTYHYLYAVPNSGKWIDTVFLVCIPASIHLDHYLRQYASTTKHDPNKPNTPISTASSLLQPGNLCLKLLCLLTYSRFMAGPIYQWAGATKSLYSCTWASESWRRI